MKKHLFFYIVCLGLVIGPLSIKVSGNFPESMASCKTTLAWQTSQADTARTIRFIKDFYADYVFGPSDYVAALKKHCTPEMLEELRKRYEYDGEGYAIWMFRSGAQDGPGQVWEVTSVVALGNGYYRVNFIDMGIKGSRTLKIVPVNGTLKFESVK